METKSKLYIQFRRLFALIFCVVLIGVCAVPAFALEDGYSVYPVIPLQKITLGRSSGGSSPLYPIGLDGFKNGIPISNPWTLGEQLVNTVPDLYVRLQLEAVNAYSASIYGEISSVDAYADQVSFYSYNFVCSVEQLRSRSSELSLVEYDYDLEDLVSFIADWNVTIVMSRLEVTDHEASWVDYTRVYNVTSSSLDVCEAIYSSLTDSELEQDFVFIRALRITATQHDYDFPNPLNFNYDAAGTNEDVEGGILAKAYNVSDYLNQFELYDERYTYVTTYDIADVDFTSWISTAIGSFLDFEIAPGISINSVLYIVIILALLLFFIKITG